MGSQNISAIDETRRLKCTISGYVNVDSHTEFIIQVEEKDSGQGKRIWSIQRRYKQFEILDKQLKKSNVDLHLPPKRFFGNKRRDFLIQRQKALQSYLNSIMNHQYLSVCPTVKRFLDPDNYSSLGEKAWENVKDLLKDESNYVLLHPLADIGWRSQKHYFLVRNLKKPNRKRILTWVWFGPDQRIPYSKVQQLVMNIHFMRNRHIVPIELAKCNVNGALFIRKYYPSGTLRDVLCCAKPLDPFIQKYCNPLHMVVLYPRLVRCIGQQLLTVMDFLHKKQLPYGHLHPCNIVYENGLVRLLDIENTILGLPSFYRPFYVHHPNVVSFETMDMYGFLNSIYEMIYGYPKWIAAPTAALLQIQERLREQPPPRDIRYLFAPISLDENRDDPEWDQNFVSVTELRNRPEFFLWPRLVVDYKEKKKTCHWRVTSHMKPILSQIAKHVLERIFAEKNHIHNVAKDLQHEGSSFSVINPQESSQISQTFRPNIGG